MIWNGYSGWVMITRKLGEGLYRTTGICPNCGKVVLQFEASAPGIDELREAMPDGCGCGWRP